MDARSDGIPEPFLITPSREDGRAVIAVSGELDLSKVDLLDQAIRNTETGDSKKIVVDLRAVSFIDSAGLSLLLRVRRRSDRIGLIPSTHDAVARLIALTGTEEALGHPGVEEPTR
jgi:anti-sigma B factor antagonist